MPTSNPKQQEIYYLLADIVPIGLVALFGIIFSLGIILSGIFSNSKFHNRIVNQLIKYIYGDENIYLVTDHPQSDDSTNTDERGREGMYVGSYRLKSDILRLFLALKAVFIITLHIMVFCDLFMVKSERGCQTDFDCYSYDSNFTEYPLEDCSGYNTTTSICYSLELDFLNAAGIMGGLFVVSRLLIVMCAKLILKIFEVIICGKLEEISSNCCIVIIFQAFFATFISGAIGVAIWGLGYQIRNEQPTDFRVAGYSFIYVAIVFSLTLTICIPWYLLHKEERDVEDLAMTLKAEEEAA